MSTKDFESFVGFPSTLDLYDTEPQTMEAEAPAEEETTTEQKPKRARRSQERTKAEVMATLSELKLSGKRGEKLHRINMAFTKDNYEYMSLMASIRGENMTEFINTLLTLSRIENADIIEKAKEIKALQLKGLEI